MQQSPNEEQVTGWKWSPLISVIVGSGLAISYLYSSRTKPVSFCATFFLLLLPIFVWVIFLSRNRKRKLASNSSEQNLQLYKNSICALKYMGAILLIYLRKLLRVPRRLRRG